MGAEVFELKGNTALYDVLGVPKSATDLEIRRAYYKLAVVYHPDKNPDGVEIFKEISFAHSILSDKSQRRLYDNQQLRRHIEGEAREYDPMMDPNVELTTEELRQFVERKRMEEEDRSRNRSEFEKQREEEMKRRAEYDAQNPTFRAEYERMRAFAKEEASKRASANFTASVHRQPTTAELMQQLGAKQQLEEEAKLSSSNTCTSSTGGGFLGSASRGVSVKRNMMQEFRERHNGETPAPNTLAVSVNPGSPGSRLAFVEDSENKSYSRETEKRIGQYANFDYRSYVEKGLLDGGGVLDAAILSDALGNYDRTR